MTGAQIGAQKPQKTCPVCSTVFIGPVNKVCCSKQCNHKARAKKRAIAQTNVYQVIDGKKQCGMCGETKAVDLFDRTPKGTITGACHECRREWRKLNKQRIRRLNGATPRTEIAALAEKKRQIRAAKSAEYQARLEEKRRNRMTPAQKWKHRYWSDQEYHEKEKKRVSEKKKTVPYWYANQLLGGSSTKRYPPELVFTKQLSKRIDNFIKEQRP
jgi:hypothetical protein